MADPQDRPDQTPDTAAQGADGAAPPPLLGGRDRR